MRVPLAQRNTRQITVRPLRVSSTPIQTRQVNTGLGWWDSFWLTGRDVRDFADRVDVSMASMDRDIRPFTLDDATAIETAATHLDEIGQSDLAASYRNKAAQIRQAIATTAARPALPGDFVAAWKLFYDGWRRFSDAHQTFWETSANSSQVWDAIENYQRQLSDWRARYSALGYSPSFPELPTPPIEASWKGVVGLVAVTGLAGAGLYWWAKKSEHSEMAKHESEHS